MITIILPVLNEEKYLPHCLDSILSQDFPSSEMEVLVVDGMSIDGSRSIIHQYQSRHPFVRLVDNPSRTAPYAMNKGIEEAQGDVIVRMDAHAEYPSNYLSALYARLIALQADNVGCVCKTDVLHKTAKSLAIREVLCNKLGVGNSTFRTGCSEVMRVDTVPFGCFPKKTFERYGLYDVRLTRNQDIELNKRIVRKGGSVYIVPDTYCTYYARETFSELAGNNYRNGLWNILTVYFTKTFSSLSVRHFIPLLFVLSLIGGLLLSFITPLPLLSLFLVYGLVVGGVSISLPCRKRLNVFCLVSAFFVLHVSYGVGSFVGLLRVLFGKRE